MSAIKLFLLSYWDSEFNVLLQHNQAYPDEHSLRQWGFSKEQITRQRVRHLLEEYRVMIHKEAESRSKQGEPSDYDASQILHPQKKKGKEGS